MSPKSSVHYYPQPWPICWLKMQWDLALWCSRWPADSGMHIHVVWNEALLQAALTPAQFRLETEEFMQHLETANATRTRWEVSRTHEARGHAVQLHWGHRMEGPTP